jgi:hypothetical protein
MLLAILLLGLATTAPALPDLSGAYTLEGSSTNTAYRGTVTLAWQGAYRLPDKRDADIYQVEWLYENGHKDLGVGVRMADHLYVAWSVTPLVELYVAVPADSSKDRIAYGFRRDGLVKLIGLVGPKGAPSGAYSFSGIALEPDGTRRGTFACEGTIRIDARPAGLVLTGAGTNHVPEAHGFEMEGAGMTLKDGRFLYSSAAKGRDPNGVGDFAIDGARLTGELYNRLRLYRAYETLTKK